MKIRCMVDDWEDVTKGKLYNVHRSVKDSHSAELLCFFDDAGDENCIYIDQDHWEVVEGFSEPLDFPVGTQCQARTYQNGSWCRWKDITILGYYEDLVWFSHGDSRFSGKLSEMEFREQKSERDEYVEKVTSMLYHTYSSDEKAMETLAGHLYDMGFKAPEESK